MLHVPHVEYFEMVKLEALLRRRRAVFHPLPCSRVTEVNRLGADAQLVSSHHYLVIFYPFVEQLTVFHTSGLVAIVFYPPSPRPPSPSGKWHMPKRYVNYT